MKKQYYWASIFAIGLAIQPLLVHADVVKEINHMEISQQQTLRLSGLLTDANGDPIIGATIKVQGTTNRGVISDIDGRYSIQVNPGEILEFSYIGFVTVEHRVKKGEDTFNLGTVAK